MKNKSSIIKLFLVFTIPLFLFQNCSEETDEEVVNEETIQDNSKLLEILKQWGYSEEEIEDRGKYYVVQGDMFFDKGKEYSSPNDINSSGSKASKSSNVKQRRTPFPVTITNINVFLDSGLDTDWINASKSAIDRWNTVNSGLTLTEVFSAASAHIEIMYDIDDPSFTPLLAANVFGAGLPPTSNGLPGARTWINENFSFPNICNSPMTQNARIANVQHELGHNLGLHHTNDTNQPLIPGTPTTDAGSVMNEGQACTISDFSNDDELAIEILFPVPPPPVPSISGPDYMGLGVNFATWTYDGGIANVQTYVWWYKKINNGGIAPVALGYGSTMSFLAFADTYYSNISQGTSDFEIYLEVIDANGDSYISSTYTITKKGKYKLGSL